MIIVSVYCNDGNDNGDHNCDGVGDDAYAQDGDDDDGERETLDSSICVGKEGENPGKPVNSARRPYLNMHTAHCWSWSPWSSWWWYWLWRKRRWKPVNNTSPYLNMTTHDDDDDDDDLENVDANDDFGKVLQLQWWWWQIRRNRTIFSLNVYGVDVFHKNCDHKHEDGGEDQDNNDDNHDHDDDDALKVSPWPLSLSLLSLDIFRGF